MKADGASTPAAAPRPAPVPDRPGKTAAPAALTAMAGRFAAQLEKQGGGKPGPEKLNPEKPGPEKQGRADKAGEQPASVGTHAAGSEPGLGRQVTTRQDDEGGEGPWAGMGGGVSPGLAPASPAKPAAGAVAMPDTALLDRIAAQIAEPHGVRGAEGAHLALPPGSLAAGALVVRGADGGLAIRITGLDPRLGPAQTLRLRSGLERALARRGVEVTTLELERTAPAHDYRGRASVTSRAV